MNYTGVGCVPGQWLEPESDDRHETALHGAVCRAADSVIQYLVDKGAKLDERCGGKTPAG
jgi:hypothetical protein